MRRFQVLIQYYSLEPGKVGQPIDTPLCIASHNSARAAGETLGSMISGKLSRSFGNDGRGGVRLFVFDSETGRQYARNDLPRPRQAKLSLYENDEFVRQIEADNAADERAERAIEAAANGDGIAELNGRD